ncbi:hypothetical protein ACWIUD_10435 [Helicobacter sp. 23-1044]
MMKAVLLSFIAVFVLMANEAKAPEAQATIASADPDIKLKDDIVGFEREQFFQDNGGNVDDPFVYVYRQPEDMAEREAKKVQLAQDVLTLKVKSIVVAPDSAMGSAEKQRYVAHINDKWVKECKVESGKQICDEIVGWKVIKIDKDKVTLRVADARIKGLDDVNLAVMPKKVEIIVSKFNDK